MNIIKQFAADYFNIATLVAQDLSFLLANVRTSLHSFSGCIIAVLSSKMGEGKMKRIVKRLMVIFIIAMFAAQILTVLPINVSASDPPTGFWQKIPYVGTHPNMDEIYDMVQTSEGYALVGESHPYNDFNGDGWLLITNQFGEVTDESGNLLPGCYDITYTDPYNSDNEQVFKSLVATGDGGFALAGTADWWHLDQPE